MSKEFKIIVIIFVIVSLLSGISYLAMGNNENTNKTETSKKIDKSELKSKIPKNLKLTDEEITIEDGVLHFSVNITNKDKKSIALKQVNILIKDPKNNVISDFLVTLNFKLKSKEEIQITSQDEIPYIGKTKKAVYIFETK